LFVFFVFLLVFRFINLIFYFLLPGLLIWLFPRCYSGNCQIMKHLRDIILFGFRCVHQNWSHQTFVWSRDDHYPVCWLDIRQDSEFATGYGYRKIACKRELDTDVVLKVWWFLFVGCLNKSRLLLQNSNCKWATALSISVEIMYFAVTPRCFQGQQRAGTLLLLFFQKGSKGGWGNFS